MRGDRPFEYYNCCWELGFTPHARGSTQWSQHQPEVWAVYPACAGIDRGGITVLWILLRLPRMRGDRPLEHLQIRKGFLFTPHARGSTAGWDYMHPLECVYPACAGIDPSRHRMGWQSERLPRMRGDRPDVARRLYKEGRFTPHARGSTPTVAMYSSTFFVYPACAGIDLVEQTAPRSCQRLPRMRGDRP